MGPCGPRTVVPLDRWRDRSVGRFLSSDDALYGAGRVDLDRGRGGAQPLSGWRRAGWRRTGAETVRNGATGADGGDSTHLRAKHLVKKKHERGLGLRLWCVVRDVGMRN